MTFKRALCLGLASVFFAIGISVVIVTGFHLYRSQYRVCMTGKMLFPKGDGYVDLGEIEFCGDNLSVSSLYGPSLERHLFNLRAENARLQMKLDECKKFTTVSYRRGDINVK